MKPTNWSMFHGDAAHTGLAEGSRIGRHTIESLKLLHDVEIPGPVLSVPALVDGFMYVGLANNHELPGANGGKLLKIELATGSTVAHFEWAIDPTDGDSHGFMGMGCTPAVSGGQLCFSAFNGKFYCLDTASLKQLWVVDLRNADSAHKQPVTNPGYPGDPPAAGWSSPAVVDTNSSVYVGMGEGENRGCYGFVYCIDTRSGDINWIYCTCQYEEGVPNLPNVLPPDALLAAPQAPFSLGPCNPAVRGGSVWSSIAYDNQLNRLYCATGNPSPDSALPSKGFSNGILALDAGSGAFRGFFQPPPESSYRATDVDVDFGGSPTLFTVNGRRLVGAGCKNGGYFVLDAATLELLRWRQLLPYFNDGSQIPSVDPHVGPNDPRIDPQVPNYVSDSEDQENYSGIVGGDGAYDTLQCHAAIAARGAAPSIPPRDGAAPWSKRTPGATWRNGAIDVIGQSSRRDWKKGCGYHRRSLAETLMYRLKVLTGRNLAARTIGAQATEIAIRAGLLNRMTSLARPSQSVRIA